MAQSPIYDQINDNLKKAIKDQVATLETLVDDIPEQSDHYRVMCEGADLVLDILKRASICDKSISGWLKALSRDQLDFVKEKVIDLINQKDNENRVKLWAIKSSYWGVDGSGYYRSFKEAAAGLIVALNNDSVECEEKKNTLSIYPVFICKI